jgi:hypothetical protein
MPGLEPGIHVFLARSLDKSWMAGTTAALGISMNYG